MRLHKASNNNNYCQNNDGQKKNHVPACPVETNEDEQGAGLSWRKFATYSA